MADIVNPNMVQHKEENDILAELKKDLDSEGADNEKYLKLAAMADERYPGKGYGAILRDIAREEKIHHKHIQSILNDMQKATED